MVVQVYIIREICVIDWVQLPQKIMCKFEYEIQAWIED